MLVNKFYQDLVIIFNTFCIQDLLDTFEELGGNGLSVFSFDSKLDNGTSRVQGFKDFIFVVTCENEPTVTSKFLNKCPKTELYVVGRIVCLINDNDFVFSSCCKRNGRSEVLRIVSDSIKESTFVGSVDDINVSS